MVIFHSYISSPEGMSNDQLARIAPPDLDPCWRQQIWIGRLAQLKSMFFQPKLIAHILFFFEAVWFEKMKSYWFYRSFQPWHRSAARLSSQLNDCDQVHQPGRLRVGKQGWLGKGQLGSTRSLPQWSCFILWRDTWKNLKTSIFVILV